MLMFKCRVTFGFSFFEYLWGELNWKSEKDLNMRI